MSGQAGGRCPVCETRCDPSQLLHAPGTGPPERSRDYLIFIVSIIVGSISIHESNRTTNTLIQVPLVAVIWGLALMWVSCRWDASKAQKTEYRLLWLVVTCAATNRPNVLLPVQIALSVVSVGVGLGILIYVFSVARVMFFKVAGGYLAIAGGAGLLISTLAILSGAGAKVTVLGTLRPLSPESTLTTTGTCLVVMVVGLSLFWVGALFRRRTVANAG